MEGIAGRNEVEIAYSSPDVCVVNAGLRPPVGTVDDLSHASVGILDVNDMRAMSFFLRQRGQRQEGLCERGTRRGAGVGGIVGGSGGGGLLESPSFSLLLSFFLLLLMFGGGISPAHGEHGGHLFDPLFFLLIIGVLL